MLPITSREYKVMIDHRLFSDRAKGVQRIQLDLKQIAKKLKIEATKEFDTIEQRTLRFLDTANESILNNQLILRHRKKDDSKGEGEFTLKCRIEDRYLAAGKDIEPTAGIEGTPKFEEDIAAPFRSRFSKSQTIKYKSKEMPSTLADAAQLFPILGELKWNGKLCKPAMPIGIVGGLIHHEQVHKGFKLDLAPKTIATVAIILWSKSREGESQCAELSFRYESKSEKFDIEAVEQAYILFDTIQTLEWYIPGGTTKTQFAYGGES